MGMEKPFSLAIDGPSGAGKSTIARASALRFGFIYVDTGAMYRTIGLAALRSGLGPHEQEGVRAMLPGLRIDLRYGPSGEQRMFLGNEDVSALIRTQEVAMYASCVSAMPEVRAHLLEAQRSLARTHDVIMDGRDIATVVLPDADLKIFLTASAEKRAERRWEELRARGSEEEFGQVLREIVERDRQDEERAAAPLKIAEGAVVVDTSELSLKESVERVCALIEERLGGVRG